MTASRRDALICGTLAASFAAIGIYFAVQPSWWCVPAFYIATLLGWCERRLTAHHRRHLGAQDRAPEASATCCSVWVHSDGEVHGPNCTRSAA